MPIFLLFIYLRIYFDEIPYLINYGRPEILPPYSVYLNVFWDEPVLGGLSGPSLLRMESLSEWTLFLQPFLSVWFFPLFSLIYAFLSPLLLSLLNTKESHDRLLFSFLSDSLFIFVRQVQNLHKSDGHPAIPRLPPDTMSCIVTALKPNLKLFN